MKFLLLVIAIAVYANMITHWFEPAQWVKDKLGKAGSVKILNCPKCMGFWLGFFLGWFVDTGYNPIISALLVAPLSALSAFIIFEVIAKYENA